MRDFFENTATSGEKQLETWKRWKSFTNLSKNDYKELLSLVDLSDDEKEIANKLENLFSSAFSYDASRSEWSTEDWEFCKKLVSYISKTRSMRKRMVGNPFERDGKMTTWMRNLLIRGHDPRKPLRD